jgi:thiamine pyrophosphate-dependent acetolactate synthase large subunit-like protein
MTTRDKIPGSTSHNTKEELMEYFEDETTLKQHVKEIAKLLNNSSHTTIYTGAGISTSAKIPDYR